jgi:hypothetical protein
MTRDEQISKLHKAHQSFVRVVLSLSEEGFLRPLGGWTPRDIVAHLIGWNRNILVGCQQIRTGISPFYHYDGPNDYRKENAKSIARYGSRERSVLLDELANSKDELVAYVTGLDENDWDKDWGPQHYRGGPATIARSIQSLTKDYLNHTEEIVKAYK